jgi:hypothetical protein
VEKALKDALAMDRARLKIGKISEFGLLEMSRQRLRQSLMETNTHLCPTCLGSGRLLSLPMQSMRALRAIERMASVSGSDKLISARGSSEVILCLLNEHRKFLCDIEKKYNKTIYIVADSSCPSGSFEITSPVVLEDTAAKEVFVAPKKRRRNRGKPTNLGNEKVGTQGGHIAAPKEEKVSEKNPAKFPTAPTSPGPSSGSTVLLPSAPQKHRLPNPENNNNAKGPSNGTSKNQKTADQINGKDNQSHESSGISMLPLPQNAPRVTQKTLQGISETDEKIDSNGIIPWAPHHPGMTPAPHSNTSPALRVNGKASSKKGLNGGKTMHALVLTTAASADENGHVKHSKSGTGDKDANPNDHTGTHGNKINHGGKGSASTKGANAIENMGKSRTQKVGRGGDQKRVAMAPLPEIVSRKTRVSLESSDDLLLGNPSEGSSRESKKAPSNLTKPASNSSKKSPKSQTINPSPSLDLNASPLQKNNGSNNGLSKSSKNADVQVPKGNTVMAIGGPNASDGTLAKKESRRARLRKKHNVRDARIQDALINPASSVLLLASSDTPEVLPPALGSFAGTDHGVLLGTKAPKAIAATVPMATAAGCSDKSEKDGTRYESGDKLILDSKSQGKKKANGDVPENLPKSPLKPWASGSKKKSLNPSLRDVQEPSSSEGIVLAPTHSISNNGSKGGKHGQSKSGFQPQSMPPSITVHGGQLPNSAAIKNAREAAEAKGHIPDKGRDCVKGSFEGSQGAHDEKLSKAGIVLLPPHASAKHSKS